MSALAINLNQPGSYLHWNVFTISVANLVLIAVMVVIFGAALLLPFPKLHRHGGQQPEEAVAPADYSAVRREERLRQAGILRLVYSRAAITIFSSSPGSMRMPASMLWV